MSNLSWKENNLLYKTKLKEKENSSQNYRRAFGSFGDSLTYAQSSVIKMGYELEKLLLKHTPLIILDELLTKERFRSLPKGRYYCTKKAIRNSDYCIPHTEPDITILNKSGNTSFTFIELKLGVNFDTKKSMKEKEKLEANKSLIESLGFNANFYFCAFFGNSVKDVYEGVKRSVPMENLLTGQDLCKIIGADFNDIESSILSNIKSNQEEFLNKLISNPESLDILLIYLCHKEDIKDKIKRYI